MAEAARLARLEREVELLRELMLRGLAAPGEASCELVPLSAFAAAIGRTPKTIKNLVNSGDPGVVDALPRFRRHEAGGEWFTTRSEIARFLARARPVGWSPAVDEALDRFDRERRRRSTTLKRRTA